MCEALQFPPEVAESIHSESYRTKLEALLKDKVLSDEGENEAKRVRKLLCIPQKVVDQCEREVQGEIYRMACKTALAVPTESFNDELRGRVRNTRENGENFGRTCARHLRSRNKESVMAYIKDSKNEIEQGDQMKEIRKMIYFNEGVITPLVNDVTKGKAEAAAEELAKLMKEAQEAAAKEEAEEKTKAEAEVEGAKMLLSRKIFKRSELVLLLLKQLQKHPKKKKNQKKRKSSRPRSRNRRHKNKSRSRRTWTTSLEKPCIKIILCSA